MRALVVEQPGTAPVVREHPDATAGRGRTLVRVSAAPVVPLDLLCASGTSYFGAPTTPYVPGVQCVGQVEQSDLLPRGTRVFVATTAGMAPGDGGLAELCAVPDEDVVVLTEAPDDDAAVAALGLSAVAAWQCLTWRGRLAPGEHVVVLGAGGAVGQAAVGAAHALGAGLVVAVCRAASVARARAAGARVVVTSDDAGSLTDRLREACEGRADLVVDPVFGAPASAALAVLSPGGRLVNLGGSAGDTVSLSSASLRARSIDVLGYTNNALTPRQRAEALTEVLAHAATGSVRVAHGTWPLAQAREAWSAVAAGSGARAVVRCG